MYREKPMDSIQQSIIVFLGLRRLSFHKKFGHKG